jgi:hypothetical protein
VNRPEDIQLKAICLKRYTTDAFLAYGNNPSKLKVPDNYFTVKGFESTIMNPETVGQGNGMFLEDEDMDDLMDARNALLNKKADFTPHLVIDGGPGSGVGSSTGPKGRRRERSFVRTTGK